MINPKNLLFVALFLLVTSLSPIHAHAQERSFLLANPFTALVGNFFENVADGFRNLTEVTFDKFFFPSSPEKVVETSLPDPSLSEKENPNDKLVLVKTEFIDFESLKSELKKELQDYILLQIAQRPEGAPTVVYQSLATPSTPTLQSLNANEVQTIVYRSITRQSDSDASRSSVNISNLTDGGTFTDATISGASTFSGTTGTFSSGLTVSGNLLVTGNSTTTSATTTNFHSSNTITGPGSFTVNSSGNVGIGTTSPFAKLSINNTGNNTIPFAIKTNGSVGNYTATNTGIFMYDAAGEETLRIWASDPDPNDSNYNNWNLYIGAHAGESNTTDNVSGGYHNTGVGYRALTINTTGDDNSAFGVWSLFSNTTGYNNSAFGEESLYSNTTGYYNSAFGEESLYSNTTSKRNSAFGVKSLRYNTTGDGNSAFGVWSLFSNTTGYYNSAFGGESLYSNTTGYFNSAFGEESLYSNTTGYENSAFGIWSLLSNTTGYYNSAFGEKSLSSNTTGHENSAFGVKSLRYNTTGTLNTAVGYKTGLNPSDEANGLYQIVADTYMTLIGYGATKDNLSTLTNGIAIGADAHVLQSNQVVLGNDNITTTLLKGSVGIGTTSPYAKLSVVGGTSGTAFAVDTITGFTGNLLDLKVASTTKFSINQSGGLFSLASSTIGDGSTTGGLTVSGNSTTTGNAYFAGNVGIGTSSPDSKLTVIGDVTTGDFNTPSTISIKGSSGQSSDWFRAFSYSNQVTPSFSVTSAGALSVTYGTAVIGGVAHTFTGNVSITTNFAGTVPLVVKGVSGQTADLQRWYSDTTTILNVINKDGNLGLGTTSPWAKLSVAGSAGGTVPLFTVSSSTSAFATSTVFNIDSNGFVGIGRESPAYTLDVLAQGTGVIARFQSANATGCTLATDGTISCTSDERMKKNIEDLTYGLETVTNLRPVLFNWNYEDGSTLKNLGFLAQDVELLIPKLVVTDEEGMKSLNTTGMIPILVKAVQEIAEKISDIFARLAGHDDKIAELEARIAELEAIAGVSSIENTEAENELPALENAGSGDSGPDAESETNQTSTTTPDTTAEETAVEEPVTEEEPVVEEEIIEPVVEEPVPEPTPETLEP